VVLHSVGSALQVTRNLKKPDSPILTGLSNLLQLCLTMPYMGLGGQTPAEAAGSLC